MVKQWIHNCRRAGWKPTRYAILCSAHFEESCFEIDLFNKLMGQDPSLKPEAVPAYTMYLSRRFRHNANTRPRELSNRKARRLVNNELIDYLTK